MGLRVTKLDTGPDSVRIGWEDGRQGEFHYIWLRDNCGCTDCRHPDTWERLFDLLTVPEDIGPAGAEVTEAGNLVVTWPGDDHVSEYPSSWLRENCYAGDVGVEVVDLVTVSGEAGFGLVDPHLAQVPVDHGLLELGQANA